MNEETRVHQKPVDYDQLYPGRFIKAGELRGKKVTLTIADVDLEDLVGDDGKEKAKAIVSFRETPKKLVTCKTNGICLKEMFGKKLADWIGKRVRIGATLLEVRERVGRCKATMANPATGVVDVDTLRGLRDVVGEQDFGVFAVVLEGGKISPGDRVEVLQ